MYSMHQGEIFCLRQSTNTLRLTSELVDLRVWYAQWIRRALLVEPRLIELRKDDAFLCIIFTERYRSGHNGADSKSVCAKSARGFESLSLRHKLKGRLYAVLLIYLIEIG